ncbi:hypothetical protein N7532_010318 [Penicillium argentinense]|uniref:CCZ1/INTU/HSP4 first Longin domain-containing protein n=1 Tax=Penicillium argentinense TaxID=1131581 RepID=A0A9W9JYF5_9EURO|nr:uncharacterized protein N7532_010318 [Penicillium argentinense]KAJ5085547.1 hypothetical protein N7532_010318 [Penicillium argentinense]
MATPEPTSDLGENGAESKTGSSPSSNDQGFPTETVMKYLTLGYGSAWSFSKSPSPGEPAESTGNTTQQAGDAMNTARSPPPNELRNDSRNRTSGRFILGPRDDLDTLDDLEEESPAPGSDNGKPKSRIVHRFLHTHSSDGTPKKLQAIIYVNQPFVFTFLFDPATSSLSSPSLYSSIHHQLGPLQKPLLVSTSPTTASIRISQSDTSDPNKRFSTRTHPVHDFVYDPSTLTIRSSIPNIPTLPSISLKPTRTPSPSPSPSTSTPKPAPSWSRIESLAIHHRLLTTYIDTRSRPLELERTCKTNRGWWIVWMRIPSTPTLSKASLSATLSEAESGASVSTSPVPPQEAFLVRKASDYIAAGHGRVSSGARFFRDLGGASSKSGSRASETPLKLVEGIGMDARRYIEGLLKLNG